MALGYDGKLYILGIVGDPTAQQIADNYLRFVRVYADAAKEPATA